MSQLKHRFKKADRYVWQWHNGCFVCSESGADALHHIIAPTDDCYIKGNHNSSIYNSAPVHNHKCHIGNEAQLADMIPDLLARTKSWIENNTDYEDKERDEQFKELYGDLFAEQRYVI